LTLAKCASNASTVTCKDKSNKEHSFDNTNCNKEILENAELGFKKFLRWCKIESAPETNRDYIMNPDSSFVRIMERKDTEDTTDDYPPQRTFAHIHEEIEKFDCDQIEVDTEHVVCSSKEEKFIFQLHFCPTQMELEEKAILFVSESEKKLWNDQISNYAKEKNALDKIEKDAEKDALDKILDKMEVKLDKMEVKTLETISNLDKMEVKEKNELDKMEVKLDKMKDPTEQLKTLISNLNKLKKEGKCSNDDICTDITNKIDCENKLYYKSIFSSKYCTWTPDHPAFSTLKEA